MKILLWLFVIIPCFLAAMIAPVFTNAGTAILAIGIVICLAFIAGDGKR